ncbi:signal peptide protein [Filifactor alocis]|uniref:signal peptide protein n=1 Tax=Filifactor alocis TaxID=143361 RepID=UPI0028D8CF3E|nr:signal peptide protein [Filifactor alocis]
MKRMNGKSLVGSVLALSLVLAGTGYAYWTDTLSINTKATTGEFGVKFADLGLYAQYNNETLKGGWSIVDGVKHGNDDGFAADNFFMREATNYNIIAKEGSIEKYEEEAAGFNKIKFDAKLKDAKELKKGPQCYVNKANGSDKIELSIKNMYPGYAQAFRTDIVNVGDIAAKLGNIKFDVKDGDNVGNLEDMIGLAVLVNGEQYNPKVDSSEWDVFKLAKNVDPSKVFTVGGVEFVRLSALKKADFAEELKKSEPMLCAPATDNRMDLFLGVAMDPDAEGTYTTGKTTNMKANDDTLSQNKEINVEIKLLWDQFNVGKDAENPNILKKQNH